MKEAGLTPSGIYILKADEKGWTTPLVKPCFGSLDGAASIKG